MYYTFHAERVYYYIFLQNGHEIFLQFPLGATPLSRFFQFRLDQTKFSSYFVYPYFFG